MDDKLSFSDFSLGQKAALVLLHARMAKRGLAGPTVDLSDLKRKVERVEKRALGRKKGK